MPNLWGGYIIGMGGEMKVPICPICGGKNIIVLEEEACCINCKREIIPLVTPQEITNG